ncbi:MAG TPA: DUF2892 domain-containing protein [Spirochaetota bacterium]|nr:DUF2892 domain-containing protein [Spirochaetota bacterium]OPZ34284.1 MAG: hypothetical protein BWY96_03173 [Spirochaetes bacterium ADurb.BinA120]HNU93098.1 DUF2892 domain-containing protein [Spirochaetota bacterium]HPI15613.1 DUF2892 domain-containing protein [Spirochaetota bacterium]HPO46050.1 DUF2892 domain-containing protein [Spirochaetota bacterium]
MVKNVGPADRYIRFMVGIAFLLNIIILEPGFFGGFLLFVAGAGLLFSAYTGSCWAYTLLKIDTCAGACQASAEGASTQDQAN